MTEPEPASTLEPATRSVHSSHASARLGAGYIVAFALAIFGLAMALMTPAIVTLAVRIGTIDPDNYVASYGLVAGVGTLVAVVANPLFGRLSDGTTSRFGMRRPWILVGVLGVVLGAVLIGFATTVPTILAGWIVMQLFANAAIAALMGTIADQAPPAQQSFLGSLVGTTLTAAVLVGTFFVQLVDDPILQMGIPALFALLFTGIFLVVLKDRRLVPGSTSQLSFRSVASTFFFSPRKAPDFSWALLCIFLGGAGLAALAGYLVYLLQDFIGVSPDDVTTVSFYAVLVIYGLSTVVSPIAGWVSDRIRRPKSVYAAGILVLAVAAVVIVAGKSVPSFFVGIALAGVGMGIFYGTYVGLSIATLVDPATYGRDLGLVNIAATLPSSLVPLIAPYLLGVGGGSDNYPVMLLVLAGVSLLGVALLPRLRHTR